MAVGDHPGMYRRVKGGQFLAYENIHECLYVHSRLAVILIICWQVVFVAALLPRMCQDYYCSDYRQIQTAHPSNSGCVDQDLYLI